MIIGAEIRRARELAHLTQQELGARVGVSLRTVGNWERGETVPLNRAAALEEVLGNHLRSGMAPSEQSTGPRLRAATDAELLAEVARRFERTAPH